MRKVILIAIAATLIAGAAACTVHTDQHARDEAEKASQEAKQEAREAAQEAKQAGREAAAEGKAAADEARQEAEEARRGAEDARREAQQQAADARREAEDTRREAMAEARTGRDNDHDQAHGTNGEVVNINSANVQQIADATGVTAPVAQKIVAARPYTSKRDLVTKKIVDEQTYWKIQKHVTVMK